MMNKCTYMLFLLFAVFLFSCSKKKETPKPIDLYFPPVGQNEWETTTPGSLNWNTDRINELEDFLAQSGTRAFILLKDGKIVIERYWGTNLNNHLPFTQASNWYWASAGKVLTAGLAGIALDEQKLQLDVSSNQYLGNGWSMLTSAQENKITVRHHLSMTTGLDDGVPENHCTDQSCLIFKAESGTRWAYHNAPYTLLDRIISGGVNESFSTYFNRKIRDRIGMDGMWLKIDFNNVYFSTPRSMARFGLLVLNEGKWQDTQIIPAQYVKDMTLPSQEINKSYGYLWWINGQTSIMVPTLQTVFQRSLAPSAPSDLVAGLGKYGQILAVAPSQKLIVVRMGESTDGSDVPFTYLDDMWKKINLVTDR